MKLFRSSLLAVLLLQLVPASFANLGIPGTSATVDGYDTEHGTNAICWKTPSSSSQQRNISLPNPLVTNFQADSSVGVKLMSTCPSGNQIYGTAPIEWQQGDRLRTGIWYNYKVKAVVNLTALAPASLGSPVLVADEGPIAAIQVILCVLGESGFCSPFIHEESNARLAAAGENLTVARGDRHGGSHVHSPFYNMTLDPSDGPVYYLEKEVPMLVNEPGTFFAIAALQLYVKDSNQTNPEVPHLLRYDMANVVEPKIVEYQEPEDVLEVSDAVRGVVYAAIAVSASILLFLLYQTVKHRNHQIMRLTQGSFLIAFLVSALVATLSSFLLEPRNNVYCRAGHALVVTSMHLMYAITWGRLWRIHSVISPLLLQTLRQKPKMATRILQFLTRITRCSSGQPKSSQGLRREVTTTQLAILVSMFTAPQVFLQILEQILQPATQYIESNEDESIGRAVCHCHSQSAATIRYYSSALFVLLILLLLLLAYSTKSLPSLLNETRVIFESTCATLVLLLIAFCVYLVTDDPTTSPDILYIVWVALVLISALNTAIRILYPKLALIWRGETVLVSKLVSENRHNTTHSSVTRQDTFDAPTGGQNNSDGLRNRLSANPSTTTDQSNSQAAADELAEFHSHPGGPKNEGGVRSECDTALDVTETEALKDSDGIDNLAETDDLAAQTPRRRDTLVRFLANPSEHSRRNIGSQPNNRQVVIKRDTTPSRRLVLKMLDVQSHLAHMNERIMSGLSVSEEDWDQARLLSMNLGKTFTQDVTFDWESSEARVDFPEEE